MAQLPDSHDLRNTLSGETSIHAPERTIADSLDTLALAADLNDQFDVTFRSQRSKIPAFRSPFLEKVTSPVIQLFDKWASGEASLDESAHPDDEYANTEYRRIKTDERKISKEKMIRDIKSLDPDLKWLVSRLEDIGLTDEIAKTLFHCVSFNPESERVANGSDDRYGTDYCSYDIKFGNQEKLESLYNNPENNLAMTLASAVVAELLQRESLVRRKILAELAAMENNIQIKALFEDPEFRRRFGKDVPSGGFYADVHPELMYYRQTGAISLPIQGIRVNVAYDNYVQELDPITIDTGSLASFYAGDPVIVQEMLHSVYLQIGKQLETPKGIQPILPTDIKDAYNSEALNPNQWRDADFQINITEGEKNGDIPFIPGNLSKLGGRKHTTQNTLTLIRDKGTGKVIQTMNRLDHRRVDAMAYIKADENLSDAEEALMDLRNRMNGSDKISRQLKASNHLPEVMRVARAQSDKDHEEEMKALENARPELSASITLSHAYEDQLSKRLQNFGKQGANGTSLNGRILSTLLNFREADRAKYLCNPAILHGYTTAMLQNIYSDIGAYQPCRWVNWLEKNRRGNVIPCEGVIPHQLGDFYRDCIDGATSFSPDPARGEAWVKSLAILAQERGRVLGRNGITASSGLAARVRGFRKIAANAARLNQPRESVYVRSSVGGTLASAVQGGSVEGFTTALTYHHNESLRSSISKTKIGRMITFRTETPSVLADSNYENELIKNGRRDLLTDITKDQGSIFTQLENWILADIEAFQQETDRDGKQSETFLKQVEFKRLVPGVQVLRERN